MRHRTILTIALGLFVAAAPSALAKKKDKGEEVWVHPNYASYKVGRIALLPVVSYDNNYKTESLIEGRLGAAYNGARYRWLSATAVRSMLNSAGGDSAIKALRQSLLKNPRLDSLEAVSLCGRLRVDALFAIRADQWEQVEIPYDQSGKPSTTIRLTGVLVGATGTQLWKASSSQTGEGAYQTANSNLIGARVSSPDLKPVTGQAGAPAFEEVLTQLLNRWIAQFPPPPAATEGTTTAAPPAAADTLKTPPSSEPK